jgi:hypothetical protein
VRSLGAWIVPLGGSTGVVLGVLIARILNADCNTAAEAYSGCTHYDPGRLAVVGAAGGVLLGIFAWGPWHHDARPVDDDPPVDA